MAGECRHFNESWTLRQLVSAYESATYHRFQSIAGIAAALFNSQRTKRVDKVWNWIDLHPWHQQPRKLSGRETLAKAAVAFATDFEWAAGFSPEVLSGNI
jgi:hypothetical protein